MEPNESQQHHLSSYFTTTTTTPATTTPSPTNGLLPPPPNSASDGGGGPHMVFPHSVGPSSAAVSTAPVEPTRRKRGRPRKYGTPEQALAAKKTTSSSSNSFPREKREATSSTSPAYSGSSRKSQQLLALGNAGQGFTPHVINVSAGEDVAQKIMLFVQQSRREICILSASGSISNASLRQPATSGGNITYEGRFEIISLSGSYVRTDIGGRTGGLSVCLSNTDGHIIGGGVGGPLTAGGPVQVIVGTFVLDNKKDVNTGVKVDASPVGGPSMSNMGFRSPGDSTGRNPVRGNDDHPTMGGNPFMIPPLGMHVAPSRPTDWRGGPDTRVNTGYDLTGHGAHQSPENGDYEQFPD
ncbi:AT-hook motif nuclear-localized protein 14 isoform X2 [Jatropha curcas]|uniref:AT-hook motif nuclear-localized protein 14 isoform X2 n=1 Tax=Jatropha curcas TaxID=180498 RepID=UPI0018946A3C|nr:AT-hook motif nuclear-localized protein 14 isoform X2 [Jatropha curcas]